MWLTRTNWLDGQSPSGNDFSNLGLDIRTWSGTVDAANNPLVGLSLMRFTPAALPSVPSAGSFVYDTADANLKFYNGAHWSIVGGVTSALGDPGSNGLVKRTALNATAVATPGTDYYVPGAAITSNLDLQATLLVGPISSATSRIRLGRAGTSGNNFQLRTNSDLATNAQDDITQPGWATILGGSTDSWGLYRTAAGTPSAWARLVYVSSAGFLSLGSVMGAPNYPL